VHAQNKLAVVQQIKSAPVYMTRTTDSNLVTELIPGTFVYAENSNQQLISIRYFSQNDREFNDGFIEKTALFIIDNEKSTSKNTFYNNYLTKFNQEAKSKKFNNEDLDYGYNLLTSYITDQLCTTKDALLLNKFIESLAALNTSLEEKQEFALTELLICMPTELIDILNKWENINDKKSLSNHLLKGLKDYYAVEDEENTTNKEFLKHYQTFQQIKF